MGRCRALSGCLVYKLNGPNSRCTRAERGAKFVMLSTFTGTSGVRFRSGQCNFITRAALGKEGVVLLGPAAFVGLDNGTIEC